MWNWVKNFHEFLFYQSTNVKTDQLCSFSFCFFFLVLLFLSICTFVLFSPMSATSQMMKRDSFLLCIGYFVRAHNYSSYGFVAAPYITIVTNSCLLRMLNDNICWCTLCVRNNQPTNQVKTKHQMAREKSNKKVNEKSKQIMYANRVPETHSKLIFLQQSMEHIMWSWDLVESKKKLHKIQQQQVEAKMPSTCVLYEATGINLHANTSKDMQCTCMKFGKIFE